MNVMTESDDKTRWVVAYVLFAIAELLAFGAAYEANRHNALWYFSYVLPLISIIPIVSSRSTISFYKKKFDSKVDSALLLDLSFRLWTIVILSYVILMMAIVVSGRR
jgi:hypothetical protein